MLTLYEAKADPDGGEWLDLHKTGRRIHLATLKAKQNTRDLYWDTWERPVGNMGLTETCAIKLRWTRR